MDNEIKLNLGCGSDIMAGWVNIDAYNDAADVKANVKELPYPDNFVDVILASHVIEHFHFREAFGVLLEWRRVLKPDGKLIIETPDLLATCQEFVNASEEWRVALYGQFFSHPWMPGQTHYFLYTETQLGGTLLQCGYRNIVRVPPDSTYSRISNANHLFLRMEAIK